MIGQPTASETCPLDSCTSQYMFPDPLLFFRLLLGFQPVSLTQRAWQRVLHTRILHYSSSLPWKRICNMNLAGKSSCLDKLLKWSKKKRLKSIFLLRSTQLQQYANKRKHYRSDFLHHIQRFYTNFSMSTIMVSWYFWRSLCLWINYCDSCSQ